MYQIEVSRYGGLILKVINTDDNGFLII